MDAATSFVTSPAAPSSSPSAHERLKRYDARFESLLRLANHRPLTPDHRAAAHAALRALKVDLDHDYRALIMAARYGTLTHPELAYLLPAVEQALADLHIRDNADPSTKVWFDAVNTARRGIRFSISQLNTPIPTSPLARIPWPSSLKRSTQRTSQRTTRFLSNLTETLRSFTSSLAFRCGLSLLAIHRHLSPKPLAPTSPSPFTPRTH